MNEYVGENFQYFEDHTTYFLAHDGLNPLSFDLWFSPTKKYYCGANCKVCYIKGILDEALPVHLNSIPEKITEEQTKHWYSIFDYFYVIRANDDMTYMKNNYPHVFGWYKEHASLFEYGMTDNAIVLHHDILMNEIDLKGIAEISLSDFFLNRVNAKKNYNKVMEILQDYMDKYGLCKVKIIRTLDEDLQPHVYELFDWLNERGVENCIQSDLRDGRNCRYDLEDTFNYQNSYTMNYENVKYQIYREALHLYNDQWFFNIDDATNIRAKPFHVIKDKFNPELLMTDMLKEKLEYYRISGNQLQGTDDKIADKFRRYYINSSDMFTVNDDFNFIPKFMLSDQSKFYTKMVDRGYKVTDVGLFKPNGNPKAIVEFKER